MVLAKEETRAKYRSGAMKVLLVIILLSTTAFAQEIDTFDAKRQEMINHQIKNRGITDDKVLEIANAKKAILLTADKDFGEFVFRQHRLTHGVVLVRLAGRPPMQKAEIVSAVINQYAEELKGVFSVIRPGIIRIRRNI
ncbi:MAG: DUF5615 family PIN-like protein, partial [Proteobacteria bacterium]|nr:DUF5615 family PIN-like protein [Pseudomonadota bacterium]